MSLVAAAQIAFLIAGLGITLNLKSDKFEARHGAVRTAGKSAGGGKERVIPNPTGGPHAAGRGRRS